MASVGVLVLKDRVHCVLPLQWKSVPKTELMDSKLKCSFLEEEAPQPSEKAVEAADQCAAPTVSVVGGACCVLFWYST